MKLKHMKETILKILTEIRPEFDYSKSLNFIEEGMLDSFDIIQLVDALDNTYGISIEGTDIIPENFANVNSITQLLIKNSV